MRLIDNSQIAFRRQSCTRKCGSRVAWKKGYGADKPTYMGQISEVRFSAVHDVFDKSMGRVDMQLQCSFGPSSSQKLSLPR